MILPSFLIKRQRSPSSRRAWIEIPGGIAGRRKRPGRPPRGGRGLKSLDGRTGVLDIPSPSSRRAWIEIEVGMGSVSVKPRRPPRGGRGLKFVRIHCHIQLVPVALLAEGVD